MKTRVLIILLIGFTVNCVFSQSNLNEYKYIIVPSKYDFLKSENQYNLNALTEFLFEKYGFIPILEGQVYPEDLNSDLCLALKSDVEKGKGLFKTKLKVFLRNCKGEIVFTSREGETREKNFKVSYHLALRDAFKSFETINYSYVPSKKKDAVIAIAKKEDVARDEVEKLKEEIKELKKTKEKTEITPKKKSEVLTVTPRESKNLLYAQPIAAGFQVVDSTPKVVMILLETPLEKTFIVKNENAIIYWRDGLWYLSKNDGQKISVEPLNIKF